jgi:uracil-DNA glycosylase
MRELGYDAPRLKFGHGLHYRLEAPILAGPKHLIASYHPSRQNTQTGRLTPEMLNDVFGLARSLLN